MDDKHDDHDSLDNDREVKRIGEAPMALGLGDGQVDEPVVEPVDEPESEIEDQPAPSRQESDAEETPWLEWSFEECEA